jgi:glycosyltransferase involved in cell wall biosynthesis
VPAGAVTQIYNGVDTRRFSAGAERAAVDGSPFNDSQFWIFGTVGRLATVKDQAALISALARAHRSRADARDRMRLVIVGDGPLRDELNQLARSEGVSGAVWFAGARSDIARVMAGLDAFVLPSLAEGVSKTLLEAMSCARPVVATSGGGNVELIEQGVSGTLVPASDARALDAGLLRYFRDSDTARRHGAAARATVEARFSLDRMVTDYAALYERLAVPVRGTDAAAPMRGATLKPGEGH